jgi:MATE family multidrug resistance protein
VILLRYVATYCILDTLNMVVAGALIAAGDTRWTLGASVVLHGVFLAALLVADRAHLGLHAEWTIATVFVMVIALVWLVRFRGGAWRTIRVIGDDPVVRGPG